MFLLRGMPFVDLAHLRKTDLQDSVISYRRHKTGALLTVEIPPAAMNLIKRYQIQTPPPLPASHSQWKPEKRRRVCRIPTCLAETEL